MTNPDSSAPRSPSLPDASRRQLQHLVANTQSTPARVQRLDLDGATLWLKRPERPQSLRWRVQKGDPRRAFAADRAGLRFLAENAIPAPAVLAEGSDWFVTEHAGAPLDGILRNLSDAEATPLAAAAAETLARLHHAGARHGRPKLRDICWDGQTARLIDLERFRGRASARQMGLDWAILLHSLIETAPDHTRSFAGAVRAYRAAAPAPAVAAGTRLIRRLGWAEPLLGLALALWPGHHEIAAARHLPRAFATV